MFHILFLITITFSHFCVKRQYLTHIYLSFANISKIFLPLSHSTYFFSLFFSGMEGRPRKHGRIPTQDTFRKGPFIYRSMVSFLRMKSAHHISDLVMGWVRNSAQSSEGKEAWAWMPSQKKVWNSVSLEILLSWSQTVPSALASFLPKKSQGWSPSEWTGWISLQSKGPTRVFSNTTVQTH